MIFGKAPSTADARRIGWRQTIRGGAFNDILKGLGGNDSLFGMAAPTGSKAAPRTTGSTAASVSTR